MILYSNIRLDTAVCTHTEALRGCLRTLSGRTRKATYVRTFDLYIFGALQEPELNHLSAALFNMSNLKHLSLDIENFHAPSLATVLASALRQALLLRWLARILTSLKICRRSTFSLHALRIPSIIECDSWIASQQHLEALAIYDHSGAQWEPEARSAVIRMQTWARQSRSRSKNIFLVKYRHGWPSDVIALSQSWNAKYLASLFAFPQLISALCILVDSPSMNIYIGTEASRSFPAVETLVLAAEDDRLQQVSATFQPDAAFFLKGGLYIDIELKCHTYDFCAISKAQTLTHWLMGWSVSRCNEHAQQNRSSTVMVFEE
ncbi:hypothetical protein EV368DRAFT_85953 [Lentinula lateritia]|uniref:Uncharacterized protein n=1 Tax=Lentinula aff. lateritia TaxID=2804960 RepID=A0ACC1TS18_9AGAR|nr:hypothetical protein F5876DRAFT_79602 [Lentinula aff. lateritia]KAJ3849032.1 hypothetical protein EV368DRAFT_85953 [Lentinula lateritia]